MDADTGVRGHACPTILVDMDANKDIKNFQIADRDADMTFSKNCGNEHDMEKPRIRVSNDF